MLLSRQRPLPRHQRPSPTTKPNPLHSPLLLIRTTLFTLLPVPRNDPTGHRHQLGVVDGMAEEDDAVAVVWVWGGGGGGGG